MSPLKKLIILILFISFMVFVAFFGRIPALRFVLHLSRVDLPNLKMLTWDRRTPIAALHRLIWIHIPNAVARVDQVLTGGRVSSYLSRFSNMMLHERHWTVVVSCLAIPSEMAA
jgi:palmitoyltransferase